MPAPGTQFAADQVIHHTVPHQQHAAVHFGKIDQALRGQAGTPFGRPVRLAIAGKAGQP